jgi:hypothetical protein
LPAEPHFEGSDIEKKFERATILVKMDRSCGLSACRWQQRTAWVSKGTVPEILKHGYLSMSLISFKFRLPELETPLAHT